MRKFFYIVVICLSLTAIYIGVGPHITVFKIKTSIDKQDPEKLSENIEFHLLRKNIKGQLNAIITKRTDSDLNNNLLLDLAAAFVTTMSDKLVESFVTPNSIVELMEGRRYADSSTKEQGVNQPRDKELFEDARYTYDSLDEFSIWVSNYKGEETRFILKRIDFSWKLVNIKIPTNELSSF